MRESPPIRRKNHPPEIQGKTEPLHIFISDEHMKWFGRAMKEFGFILLAVSVISVIHQAYFLMPDMKNKHAATLAKKDATIHLLEKELEYSP